MQEIWKPVHLPEYHHLYEVSNTGRVRRVGTHKEIAQNKVNGYRYAPLYNAPDRKNTPIHRLVAFAFIPPIKGKNHIDHINADRANNRSENLRWVTPRENIHYAIANIRATRSRGEKSGLAKLTNEKVRYIRLNWPTKSATILGREVGVSHISVTNILSGKTWVHLIPTSEESANMCAFQKVGGFGRGALMRRSARP